MINNEQHTAVRCRPLWLDRSVFWLGVVLFLPPFAIFVQSLHQMAETFFEGLF